MGLLNWAPTFLGQFRANFVLSIFNCWLAFVFSENLCGRGALIWLAGVSGGGVLLLLALPTKINHSQLEALELCWVFTPQLKWGQIKRIVHLKDSVFHSELQKGIQRRFESQKEKKRNENLNPPKGFCITFRIPKGNSNLAQTEKNQKLKLKRREKKERSQKSRFLLHKFIF